LDQHDKEEIYCRMLGHHLAFTYCRQVKDGLPCHKIKDCWFEQIPIEDFLKAHYSPEQIAKALTPPGPRLASILELVEQAKARNK
jgi:hypothetical protein